MPNPQVPYAAMGEGTLHALRWHKEGQGNLRRDFTRIIADTGLPKIRFHGLGHTAASLMLNHGVPPILVSRILGHSKPSTTLDIDGHLYHEMQGEAAKIMDDLVKPIQVEILRAEESISR